VVAVEALAEAWPRIRADVKAVSRRIEAILQQVDPVSVNGDKVMLVSPYEFHKNRMNTDEVRQIIEDVIERQFGARVSVQCVTRAELDAMPRAAAAVSAPPPEPHAAAPQSAPQSHRQEERPEPYHQPEPTPPTTGTIAANDPAPAETTDPAPVIDTSRQIEAIRNIFDAEEDRD
jgi:chromosomal replication initiation ATPase DnaA